MNAIGLLLLWTALQVSLFCLAGIALYALVRRRSPAAGAWAAGAALIVAIGISALAVSPWPRWWSIDAPAAAPQRAETDQQPLAAIDSTEVRLSPGMMSPPLENHRPSDATDVAVPASPPEPRRSWQGTLAGWRGEMSRATADLSNPEWHWPAWLALAILSGCSLALIRLIVAVWAAHRFRRSARAVTEPSVLRALDDVRAQVGCARSIELRETSIECSPSTIGWLRPAIILPADWQSWRPADLRAVLAHEVAHVARGDFAISLFAQLSVVLHFYNPLVHWLARRLRLEQEMAADVCGATLAGGRQTYLTTLAEMTLRRNDPPLAWVARPFLPTRGTLMKRVEMLHRRKHLPSLVVSRSRRAAVAGILLAAAALLAGFRPPSTQAVAAPPAGEKAAARLFDLDFVPNDAQFLLALRPAELANIKGLQAVRVALTGIGMFDPLGLPLEQIEECKIATNFTDPGGTRAWHVLVVRSKKPHDWAKLAAYFTGKAEEVIAAGQKYYRSKDPRAGLLTSYWLPDDRTIVLAPADRIAETFALRGTTGGPTWAGEWQTVADAPAAMMITPRMLQPVLAGIHRNAADEAGVLPREAVVALLRGVEVAGALEVAGTMRCRSEKSARIAHATLEAAQAASRKELDAATAIDDRRRLPLMFRTMLEVIDATRLEQKGAVVELQTIVNLPVAPAAIEQELARAREATLAAASQNKLRQLGIALQVYHDAYRKFPPAVLIGPDGKTPYSWRVALLPFLEKQDLYDRYRKDEPWDSQHNRQLIAEGAELFSAPTQQPNSDCSYFLLVGPGTVFDPAQPPTRIRDITDGSSKTIGIVEAKRSVPWTKPEDIEYDPQKPLPKLGGFFPSHYHAGAMDASVHLISDDTDEATMRALITRAGREPVAFRLIMDAQREAIRRRADGPPTEPARRARSVNTMKHFGIAMHNYHDQNGHFPPAVVMGPDGKTPHSWRVELLPYFEQAELHEIYEQYKLDEPWDSQHNRQLIKPGAAFFGTAMEKPNGNSCYFMLAGPGTMGDPASDGIRIRDITDGTSNTIYFVEAERSIPWTKPQDIQYDPRKPLPKLGGFFEGGFNAALVDGSVHFLPDDVDEDMLRRTLTSAGGEVVEFPPQREAGAERRRASPPRGAARQAPSINPLKSANQLNGITQQMYNQLKSGNQLKQIAIALQIYHDTYSCFPSRVMIGPDGKTPHSWRVALLPFWEDKLADKLYERYRFDEPWNSPHNLALAKEGARLYRVPTDKPDDNCGYFMLAGPGTMADPPNRKPEIRDVTDGTSHTIYVVEAKRPIPWTKPADIEYDPKGQPPKLGGYFAGGFNASFVDGSIHFLPTDLDEPTLRALLSTRGGERIKFDGDVPKVQAK